MNIKKQIQSECIIAFIHSRLKGLGKDSDIDIKPVFNSEKLSEKAIYAGAYYRNKLEKISSFEKVQNILSTSKNFKLADIYYKSYEKLGILLDKYAPTGSEVIEGLIGLNMLVMYLEYFNHHKLNIDFERINHHIALYANEANDDKIYKDMAKLAGNIFDDYIKYIKHN